MTMLFCIAESEIKVIHTYIQHLVHGKTNKIIKVQYLGHELGEVEIYIYVCIPFFWTVLPHIIN